MLQRSAGHQSESLNFPLMSSLRDTPTSKEKINQMISDTMGLWSDLKGVNQKAVWYIWKDIQAQNWYTVTS